MKRLSSVVLSLAIVASLAAPAMAQTLEPVFIGDSYNPYPALADVKYVAVKYGQSFDGTLAAGDALNGTQYVDYYAFYGTEGDLADLRLASRDFDAYLVLSDEFGGWVGEDDESLGNGDARLVVTLPATGWYLAQATTWVENAGGAYTFSVDRFAGIPAGTPMTSIAVGETLNGTLSKPDPAAIYRSGLEEFYSLSLTSTQDLTVTLSSPDGSMDPYLYLTDATGTKIILENDDFNGLDSLVSATLDAGTYVLVVSTYDGVGGNFALEVLPGLTELSYTKDYIDDGIYFELYTVYTLSGTRGAPTPEQILRATVDPDADWSNHGKYVSAVARAINDFVADGRMTRAEGVALLKQASSGGIGKQSRGRTLEQRREWSIHRAEHGKGGVS